jgi:hypothetical protein
MSRQNIELVQAWFERWNRGDRDFSEDEYIPTRTRSRTASSFGSGPSCDMKRPSKPQGCGTDEGQVLTVRVGDQPLGCDGIFCERAWNW